MQTSNSNYHINRSPLIQATFYSLPIGMVKADGWLLKPFQFQKDILTDNAETLYNISFTLGPESEFIYY